MDVVSAPAGPSPPIHSVFTYGPYGTIIWTPSKKLWDVLPSGRRIALLDASKSQFEPHFTHVATNILETVGVPLAVGDLSRESSLEWVEDEKAEACGLGKLVWQISQGLWDVMPADRRSSLLELHMSLAHVFLHLRIVDPYMAYVLNRAAGPH